jgi:hypothetical protein
VHPGRVTSTVAQYTPPAYLQSVKPAMQASRAASAWTAGPAGIHQLKISHMKNIKIYIEYFILYLVIYYFIIKPILWMIDKSRED